MLIEYATGLNLDQKLLALATESLVVEMDTWIAFNYYE